MSQETKGATASEGSADTAEPVSAAAPSASSTEQTLTSSETAVAETSRSTLEPEAEVSGPLDPEKGPVPVRRVGRRRAAGPSRTAAAANDDVPSIGGLIYALQQKPSRRPFKVATGMSIAWALLGALLVWLTFSSDLAIGIPLSELLVRPQTLLIAAAVLLPIALFWFLAVLSWRAQELRLMSSAMTEVAVRLAEPDKLAEQSVASLGQTVRRQVMSMNDAINRSLGRAGELEALVHNEVAALERAYHENEVRVRGLINELVSERQSLTNNSDRVSDTIKGIGLEVTREIVAASEVAAKALSGATHTLTQEVQKSGSQLTARIQATNDQTAHLMSESGNSLLASLADMNKRIGSEVPALLDKLSGEQTRLTKIVEGAGRNLAALETALDERVNSLDMSLGEKTEVLRDTLQHKIKDFDDTFSDKARQLDAAIGEKMGQFDSSITAKAKTFYQALEKNSSEFDRNILERTRAVEQNMQRHAAQVDGTIAKGIEAVQRSNENITTQSIRTLDGLSQQGESLRDLSEGLLGQIRDLTEKFDQQGQSIMRAAHDLESSSFRIDTVLEARHAEMSSLLNDVSSQADVLDGAMRDGGRTGSGANLRERYNRAAQDVAQTSSRPARASAFDNGRSGDFDHMRAQLNRELEQTRSGSMESALQEQMHALETLSGYGNDHPQQVETTRPLRRAAEPMQRATSQRPPAARQQNSDGTTERWSLGDLLSRASDDMPLPVVADTGQGAQGNAGNNVALDLKNMARAIDMQTATDIWSRLIFFFIYTVYIEIYTRDGQVTFDEIGRRFVSDTAFRNTVSRYLVDFEQLLREVDKTDHGGNIVRSHLVSDMGRVYLLLAHASGRLA